MSNPPDYLALKNPHPRDKFISFDEGPHIYTVHGDSSFTSVTTWNHTHFPHFDADAIIDTDLVGTANGLKYPRTGGMETGGTGDSVSLMNPYLTVNYIIYTGVGG